MEIKYKILDNAKVDKRYCNMMNRCYREGFNKAYFNKNTVDDVWANKETGRKNFRAWHKDNYYVYGSEQIDMDKDIKVAGNTVYSDNTCLFVPHKINVAFEQISINPKYNSKLDKWTHAICINGESMNLGYYDTKEKAINAYIECKANAIKELLDEYKNGIPSEVYTYALNHISDKDNFYLKMKN